MPDAGYCLVTAGTSGLAFLVGLWIGIAHRRAAVAAYVLLLSLLVTLRAGAGAPEPRQRYAAATAVLPFQHHYSRFPPNIDPAGLQPFLRSVHNNAFPRHSPASEQERP